MKENCECSYCKHGVNEYFCVKCFYNFNECEVFHFIDGATLCPKCHPIDWNRDIMPIGYKKKEGISPLSSMLPSGSESDDHIPKS